MRLPALLVTATVALSLAVTLGGCGGTAGGDADGRQPRQERAVDDTAVTSGPLGTDRAEATSPTSDASTASEGGAEAEAEVTESEDVPKDDSVVDLTDFDTVSFVTPSGLTRCTLSAESASCDLPAGFAESEAPEWVAGCYSETNDTGRAGGVEVDRHAGWRCADGSPIAPAVAGPGASWFADTGWEPVDVDGTPMAQVPFGKTVEHSGRSCTPEPDQMRCVNAEGSGFSMNTAGVRWISTGSPVLLTADTFGPVTLDTPPAEMLDDLQGLLGPADTAGYSAGCFLGGPEWVAWGAAWGSFHISGEAADRADVQPDTWTLRAGTTSVPVELPGGLTMESTPAEVLSSDPGATTMERRFGEPGQEVVAHDLSFVFDARDRLEMVAANLWYCD